MFPGTSINPARSLGAAVFGDLHQQSTPEDEDNPVFDSHWVFWVGPLLGGLLGGLVYTFVLKDGDSPQVVVCLSEDKKYRYNYESQITLTLRIDWRWPTVNSRTRLD